MRVVSWLIFILCQNTLIFAQDSNCLSLPLGVTEVPYDDGKRTISVSKVEIDTPDEFISIESALMNAEILAKKNLSKLKLVKLSGVFKVNSCNKDGFAYVAVGVDSKSKYTAKNLDTLLNDSFKNSPTLK